jgi:hypothetical protein
MKAHRRVESTGVELAGGAELVAPVEKATARPCALEGHGVREARWRGRRATVLWRCGDAGRQSGGVVESAVAEAAHDCRVLSRCYGEASFF